MPTSIMESIPCTNSPSEPGDGSNLESMIEQLIAELLQDIQQLLGQSNDGSDDSDSSGIDGGGSGGGCGGAPMIPSLSPAMPETPSGGGTGAPSSNIGGGAPSSAGGGNGGSGASVPVKLTGDPAKDIAQDLEQNFGLNATQAAGVLGNLQQESGLQSDINQGGATGAPSSNFADDNSNGWGLAQWGGARKQGEIALAQKDGLDPGSEQANLNYMNQELSTTYSNTITDIKQQNTAQGAALAWDEDYEQASDPEMSNRDQYAQQFLSEGL